jgi:hypothetical protein
LQPECPWKSGFLIRLWPEKKISFSALKDYKSSFQKLPDYKSGRAKTKKACRKYPAGFFDNTGNLKPL